MTRRLIKAVFLFAFPQDGEWAKVKTAADSLLCRAVIVTCPPHLAGQRASPASVDTLMKFSLAQKASGPTRSLGSVKRGQRAASVADETLGFPSLLFGSAV